MEWLLYLLLGAVAGVLAGLFGVGGGAVIVPMLLLVFDLLNFAPALMVHTAVGTSFAAIVLTTLASTRAHHDMGNVEWPLWRIMAPGLLFGVMFGAWVASLLDAATLRTAIAIFLLLIAMQMLSRWQPPAVFERESRTGHVVAGAGIGWVSAFFGIGGGSLTVPYLNACGRPMKNAVATSAACGVPIAVFGALSYLVLGWSASRDVAWTSGYLYWPALLGIGISSVPCARFGAQLASKLDDATLRILFALFILTIGVYLIASN
ncbi:MAG: sulfite exporter TauE/SafE family protein [Gammaproteobacteria bacterium]|nr:sulfite exporter TauE/SafE family protein [Gammaproteobacteria bacterium]NND40286.1 sulfite exporter TauE/SafE family protein [Pseudomonadales bacterium]NNM12077.1 sulfite exporter TauE/SafE family protein [Pseudomonadales bacterium]RZV59972.1 MAG: sulfite exporter TauE/SafE family protein [Pseudomonadales bacterium]